MVAVVQEAGRSAPAVGASREIRKEMAPPGKKELLMICYFYPPTSNSGGERSGKFARYLPEHGWSPVVVTEGRADAKASEASGNERIVNVRNLLWRVLWRGIRPLRRAGAEKGTLTGRLARGLDRFLDTWVFVPDWAITWSVHALPACLGLLRPGRADAIYTTSPPVSSHLIGLILKRLTKKPWVMDLRDPWTVEPYNRALRESRTRLQVERRLERACFRKADAVVLNTPEAEARYGTLYPDLRHKLCTIPNGFDSDEFSRAAAFDAPTPWRGPDEGTFVVSHTGTFFRGEGQKVPEALFDALKGLLDEGVLSPGNCRVIFAGKINAATRQRIEGLGLAPLIDTPGVVSHLDSLRLMLLSDLLVLFDPDNDGETYVRSKLYEYLGADRPVLGMVPEGASRELLRRSGRGTLVRPEDEEGARRAIARAFERCDEPVPPARIDLGAYERRRLAGDLASLLNELG
jgi:glycosyltransferase involved in cell wall biosynthesis